MSSEMSEQSLSPEESSPSVDETPTKKKKLSFWKPGAPSLLSDAGLDGEEETGTEGREEMMGSNGTETMGCLSCLSTEQPLSDEQREEFRAAYMHMRSTMSDHMMPTLPEQSTDDEDEDEAFETFISIVTDKEKFTMCLNGEPEAHCYVPFFRMLNSILYADNIPHFAHGGNMRFHCRRSLNFLHGEPCEEKQSHVISYYAKGAHLTGLQARQLLKYILPEGFEDMRSPYAQRPSLNSNYRTFRAFRRSSAPSKFQNIRSNKSKKTIEIEDHIRQLTVKREGERTKEMVTPVKIRVHLKVKNRDELTYDDINQIRNKAKAGLNSYLSRLTRCKRGDTLQSWGSLHGFYSTLCESVNFPETFSTYSWSWSGRRNMVEIWELVETNGAATPPRQSPSPSIASSSPGRPV